MKLTLSQKLNILKSNKKFISFNVDANNNLTEFTLNNNFIRYKPNYKNFRLLDIFRNDYILNSKDNYTLNQILTHLRINLY